MALVGPSDKLSCTERTRREVHPKHRIPPNAGDPRGRLRRPTAKLTSMVGRRSVRTGTRSSPPSVWAFWSQWHAQVSADAVARRPSTIQRGGFLLRKGRDSWSGKLADPNAKRRTATVALVKPFRNYSPRAATVHRPGRTYLDSPLGSVQTGNRKLRSSRCRRESDSMADADEGGRWGKPAKRGWWTFRMKSVL